MGYLDLKPSSLASKSVTANTTNGLAMAVSQNDSGRVAQPVTNSGTSVKEQTSRTKLTDGKHEKPDNSLPPKSESSKARGGSLVNGSDAQMSAAPPIQAGGIQRHADDSASKETTESEVPPLHLALYDKFDHMLEYMQ